MKLNEKSAKFAIIGGQYQSYFYGFAASLHAAKILASKSAEYWDNWQGWHIPAIYAADDVKPVENFYGPGYAPRFGAVPVAVKSYGDRAWRTPDSLGV